MLTIIDSHTSWPEVIPSTDIKEDAVTMAIERDWNSRLGLLEIIIMDQGRQFISESFQKMCSKLGVEHRKATRNVMEMERFHRTLKDTLRPHTENANRTWLHDLQV